MHRAVAVLAAQGIVVAALAVMWVQKARIGRPAYVAELGASAGARVAIVAGRIDDAAETDGIDVISLTTLSGSAEAALSDPVRWLRAAGERLARDVAAGGES